MSHTILISVITGASALLGALIPTVAGFLNSERQRKFDKSKALLDKQREGFLRLMLALQEMLNQQKQRDQFIELQKAVIEVSMYGDLETSRAVNEYYRSLVQSTHNASPLTRQEHQQNHTAIFNAIRKSLSLGPIGNFEIVGIPVDA
jgi:hypothetical protein